MSEGDTLLDRTTSLAPFGVAGGMTPDTLDVMSRPARPVVDPVHRPHLAAADPAFRAAIELEIEELRELLAYLRDR